MKIIKNQITSKILTDIFFMILLVTVTFIIGETLLPGIISTYISPLVLFAIIFIFIFSLYFVAHTQNIYANITNSNKYLLGLSVIIFSILIAISSLKYGYLFGSIIVIFSVIIFLLLNELLQNILHNS